MNLLKSKYDNSHPSKRNTGRKRWAFTTMLLIGILLTGSISCKKNDDDVTAAGEEAESAWLQAYTSETPTGVIRYLSVNETNPTKTDISQSVEIGLNSDVYSYGEHPYTWSGDASTMTKWEVNKNTLEITPIGILSFASTALSTLEYVSEPIFLSETQGYFTGLKEGVIIEFNPSTMAIVKTFEVNPLPDSDILTSWYSEWKKYVSDGKLFLPITFDVPSSCCEYLAPNGGGAMVAVFDPEVGTINYLQDKRLRSGSTSFLVDNAGEMFVFPNRRQFFAEPYFNVDISSIPPHSSLLKFNSNGNFDVDYEFDFEEVLGEITFGTAPTFKFDNQIVLTYLDSTFQLSTSFEDRWGSVYGEGASSKYKTVLIDMDSKEAVTFTVLDKYHGVEMLANINNESYFVAYYDIGSKANSDILIQKGATNFIVVTEHEGGNFTYISKLW
ncbi:MAG: hypothetical protein AAF620_10765 [Bacteroidota bacterium]